jgi:nitroimidazol reductase NimA-like FMN-containing flavoprotein (pyridoxamine 5'-phosphate oxidase superfamily)
MTQAKASARYAQTARSRLRRLPQRGHYDQETLRAILDAGFICHVGYLVGGQPLVTPTAYWREGDYVYWHGSHASRMLGAAVAAEVCLTVTHVDGLVMARSGFHHSINYRSAMIFGRPEAVTDEAHKCAALKAFIDRLYPGRWDTLRPVTRKELKATSVLRMKIEEASAKIRTGPPKDDEDDYSLDLWAGVIPLDTVQRPAIDDARLKKGMTMPASLRSLAHIGVNKGAGRK